MITRVDNMIIGNEVIKDAWGTATKGQIVMANENFETFNAADAQALYIGVCTGTTKVTAKDGSVSEMPVIKWSDRIQKASHPRFTVAEFAAPEQAKTLIDFTDAKIVTGHRYVIRILYKDIEVAQLQFTHTYEVIAESTDATALAEAFAKKINKHTNRRVVVSLEGAVLTLTAMEKDDNEGIDSLSEYSIVSMQTSLYTTIPGALLSNQPETVSGAVVESIEGNPGSGYWKQVRDMERRAMGYKGHVFTGAYPSIEQKMMTEEGAEYDMIVIENDNLYLSPDNQYIKTTPCRTIICTFGDSDNAIRALDGFDALNVDGAETAE